MPAARFFFDAGSGAVLWAATPEDAEVWGYPVELDRLPISRDLRDVLYGLIARYDTALNWDYPRTPGRGVKRSVTISTRRYAKRSAAFGPNSARRGRFTTSSTRSTRTRTSTATWPTQPASCAADLTEILRGGRRGGWGRDART